MSNVIFKLPDLGEGLPDAEIVEWHVRQGQEVEIEQPLVSMETAKAIVEIPSPHRGRILKCHGEVGDIIDVGAPLVEFSAPDLPAGKAGARADAGTVVGEVKTGEEVVRERASGVGRVGQGIKALPAIRALAKRMNVELSMVTPSGPDGLITAEDIHRVARILEDVGPLEPLRGVRRAMARTMTQAQAEVVPVTICEDADIDHWADDEDFTLRLIAAIVAACRAEPALNAWYDSHAMGRRILERIDLGMAVDTNDGLFVPVLHDVGKRNMADLRQGLDAMKQAVHERSVPPEQLRGNTITLSNFGTMGGRYANPIVVPPTVAILAAGSSRQEVACRDGQFVPRRVLPLSLTFDHRCVTGGEATRFLMAAVQTLQGEW